MDNTVECGSALHSSSSSSLVMVTLCNRADHYTFSSCFFLLFYFLA